jgi:uncharacterized Zn-binding protein involved in type VI secretion
MNARHATPRLLCLALLAAICFTACTKQESVREVDWAKAALARNPAYEIVATDESTGVFTVRDTTTGTVSTLKLGDLIAAPRPAPMAKPAVEPAPPAAEPVQMPEMPERGDALAANQTTDTVEAAPAGNGASLAEGPGYSITRATGNKPEAAPTDALEGPGYKIERAGVELEATASKAQGKPAATVQDNVASVIEKRSDPIICQGDRLMRIDGEIIEFSGDAVIAEKGCDLYISNARISAGGVGIIARQARVHIVNSTIGGSRGSYEVSDGAEIYVARTTFTGVGRRFEGGTMNDLGGNSYESH